MGLWDGVVHLLGRDNSTKVSITNRGAKGAIAMEMLDASGNQITSFGGPVTQGTTPWIITPDAPIAVTQSGVWAISGVATSALQTTGNATLTSINGKITACNTGAVVVSTLPALPTGTNTVGVAITSPQVGTAFTGTTTNTVSYAFANVAASQTDSSIVAGNGSKIIYVLGWQAVCGATATNLTFNSKGAGAGTAISPLYANGANGGEVNPPTGICYFKTAAGEALTVTTGAGSTTGVLVQYVQT